MKIGFGCDHAGVELKQTLMDFLKEMGHECVDYGNYDPNDRTDDYPEFGRKVGEAVMRGEVEKGVLICGYHLPPTRFRESARACAASRIPRECPYSTITRTLSLSEPALSAASWPKISSALSLLPSSRA